MPRKKKTPVEDLIIPPQDQKICGTICMCQMTAVLSTVALVYLTVAIYMPYMRATNSGIDTSPVMCTTTRTKIIETCTWGSCGEWCLSKTSGACAQIYVSLRQNGSNLLFVNCTNSANKTCYGIDQENAKKYRCIADECKNLTGTFNCTQGTCINITDAFECDFRETESPLKCSGRRGKINCISMHGLQNCVRGTCERIRTPYNCDRRCVDIPTRNKNIIVLSGDRVYLSQCQKAVLQNDTEQEIWTESQNNILMTSCFAVNNTSVGIEALDCINGSVLDRSALTDLTNFTFLNYLHIYNTTILDEKRQIAPPEQDLLLANESRLLINLEGCVNTLRDECKEFLREYGKDGTDHNARARFPCFYSEKIPGTVIARFNLDKTYKEFMVGFFVPCILLIVSCFTLVLCQRSVEVGDDAKMRFKKKGEAMNTRISKDATLDNIDDALSDPGGGDHSPAP
uniref:Uncharacterized protein n=1 Tax=Cacopsylla melanoneura TaxID=428564 RepID=A0A8D9FER2_9HEMI